MAELVLLVMTEKGFGVARRLISEVPNLVSMVVIGKDPAVANDYSREIAQYCQQHSIAYCFRGEEPPIDKDTYLFVVSWRWMVDHPANRLIIFHDSLLPKYRGFSPLVNMLINGETLIGVSAVFGADMYDRGAIVGQRSTEISYPIKIAEAIKINSGNFEALAVELALIIAQGKDLSSQPQDDASASYSLWRDDEDYFVDWNQCARLIKRFVDAVGYPYLGAKTRTSTNDIVLLDEVDVVEDVDCELRQCGKVIFIEDGCPVVICGSGLLKIRQARVVSEDGPKEYLPLIRFRTRFQ